MFSRSVHLTKRCSFPSAIVRPLTSSKGTFGRPPKPGDLAAIELQAGKSAQMIHGIEAIDRPGEKLEFPTARVIR